MYSDVLLRPLLEGEKSVLGRFFKKKKKKKTLQKNWTFEIVKLRVTKYDSNSRYYGEKGKNCYKKAEYFEWEKAGKLHEYNI